MSLYAVLKLAVFAACVLSIHSKSQGDTLEQTVAADEAEDGHEDAKIKSPKIAFGEANPPSVHVPVVDSHQSLSSKDFFDNYVHNQQAVLFKRAILQSDAYRLWSDEYFKNLENIPKGHDVLVESRKKENRTSPPTRMPLKDFIEIYNLTDQYMVEAVPEFLRKDFMLPHHLQCEQLMKDIIVETFMWFSSGGTSSVVHTDSVENMNCLVAGKKRFTFVPPEHASKVLFDHPEGAYSGIDVDDVDYEKYPGLTTVKFMHADVEAGDCLYIPYKWIHQVRSYHRNLAVNIWWDTFRNADLVLDRCNSVFDPSWTLDRVELTGFGDMEKSPAMVRDHINSVIYAEKSIDFETFIIKIGINVLQDPEFQKTSLYREIIDSFEQSFGVMDVDKNQLLDSTDLEALTNDDWQSIGNTFSVIHDAIENWIEEREEAAKNKPSQRLERDEL